MGSRFGLRPWVSFALSFVFLALAIGPPRRGDASPRRQAGPTLTVKTPSGGFPERGYPSIGGARLPASRHLFLRQCPAKGIDPRGEVCDSPHWVYSPGQTDVWIDEHGHIWEGTDVKPVRRVMNPDGPTPADPRAATVDCAATPCVLAIFAHDGVSQDPLATVGLTFAGPPGPPRATSLSATPTRNLADGQAVTVTGEHWMGPTDRFGIYQCGPPDPTAGQQCGKTAYGRVDSRGRLSARILVRAKFKSSMGSLVDCRRVTCRLSVGIPLEFESDEQTRQQARPSRS